MDYTRGIRGGPLGQSMRTATVVGKNRRPMSEPQPASPNRGRMPPLIMVRAFEAAARTGTMRKAADDIGISHTVISRHVRLLEEWMRVKLLIAGPRGIILTTEGKVFYKAVARAFGAIVAVTAELRPLRQCGTIRIWCMPGLALRWLTPRLPRVEEILQGADILIRATDRTPDFSAGEADVVIGYCVADVPDGAMRLVRPRFFPVASPQWIRQWVSKNGQPKAPRDLVRADLIHEDTRQHWIDWFEAAGVVLQRPLSGPRLSDAILGYDAAISGLGVALGTRLTASGELAQGQLVELLRTNLRLGSYFLMLAPALREDPAFIRFAEWLVETLNQDETATTT